MEKTVLLAFVISSCLLKAANAQNQRPIFEKTFYVAEMVEEQAVGSPIIQLKASIVDGGVATFRLDSTVTLFSIDQTTGWISVAGRLDREASDTRRFDAYAKNTANGLESQVQVVVHLTDVNDNTPAFLNLPATVKLRENIDVGTVVYTVAATDQDTSRNALLMYSIIEGNKEEKFTIDLYSGKISIKSKLDFEITGEYNITLRVQDSGQNSTKSNTSLLRVKVSDHDDQPAKFLQKRYHATVAENSPMGTVVLTVKAIDMDLAINSPVYYDIEEDSNTRYVFAIDNITGVITVNASIDRETSPELQLRVSATSTMFNPDYAIVFISVSDVNDNRPTFPKARYDVAISENAKPGTMLLGVQAHDKDKDVNAELGYSIVGGDAKFSVSQNGSVMLAGTVDREQQSGYSFVVVAAETKTAEKYDTSAAVHVKITDINDNAPQFDQLNYTVFVKENLPYGTSIITYSYSSKVKATDKDSGDNAFISYKIKHNASVVTWQKFSINSETGDIQTLSPLDREVIVKDENDNSPVFSKRLFDVSITENSALDTLIFKEKAVDADVAANARLTYEIISGGAGKFYINESSGEIRIKAKLNREAKEIYEMIIVAKDAKGKNGTTKLRIKVLDINDNDPLFSLPSYNFYVMEEVSGAVVGQVQATDLDYGSNSNITYIFTSGQDGFELDSRTGTLKTKIALDYERIQEYHFQVTATDDGIPIRRSSIANVTVNVINSNDHKPVFDSRFYSYNITENRIPHVIGYLKATDNDSGFHGALHYRIVSGNETGAFALNAASGALSSTKALDREVQSLYLLVVSVADRNGQKGALEDLAAVQVMVEVSNAMQVVVEVRNTVEVVVEVSDTVQVVVEVSNTLEVVVEVSNTVQVAVEVSNIVQVVVEVSNTVEVVVKVSNTVQVVVEVSNTLEVVVEVSNTVQVAVEVSNIVQVVVEVSNIVQVVVEVSNTVEVVVEVSDTVQVVVEVSNTLEVVVEVSNTVQVAVEVSNIVQVVVEVSNTVEVVVKVSNTVQVVVEVSNTVEVVVEVSDTVQVVVEDANDNSPKFTKESSSITLKEDAPVGSFVFSFKAADSDSGVNGEISYSIANGNKNNRFFIDPNSGRISIHSAIDRDPPYNEQGFELTIQASDKGSMQRTSFAKLFITVSDANDNAPICLTDGNVVSILENLPIGSEVYTPNCTDKDNGNSGLIKYTLIKGADQGFSADATSGLISTTMLFDYDQGVRQFELTLQASDSGTPALQSTTKVTVKVVNVNDNSPWFQYTGPYAFIEGNYAKQRLKIGQLKAFDNDSDSVLSSFGELSYSFVNLSSYDYEFYWQFKKLSSVTTTEDRKSNASAVLNGARLVTDAAMGQVLLIPGAPTSVLLGDFQGDCISDPTLCSRGLTISMWIKFEAGGFLLSSGGQSSQSTGFSFDYSSGFYTLRLATRTKEYVMKLNSIPSSWFYFTFTWSTANGLFYYENGVLVSKTYTVREVQRTTDLHTQLFLGRPNDLSTSSQVYGRLYIGEFVIWRLQLEDFAVKHAFLNSERKTGMPMSHPSTYFDLFHIGKNTGEIFAVADIDREKKSSYALDVKVSDKDPVQPKSNYTQVMLNVLDANDNVPQFSNSSFSLQLAENTVFNTEVIQLTALDSDEGSNGLVRYSIMSGNTANAFVIDSKTGMIKTAGGVDREKTSRYTLHVSASDGGNPPRASVVTVHIEILDENDEFPIFAQQQYIQSIKENLPVGRTVLQVEATDKDLGRNGLVLYNLTSDFFAIDQTDGTITTSAVLDRESIAQHKLIVFATDGGNPSKVSSVSVIINVLDENDNAPKFTKSIYNAVVSENRKIGSSVITVTAVDLDSTDNGKVSYSIRGGDGKFSIDSNSGLVKVADSIDREKYTNGFKLIITASDKGTPKLSSSSILLVNVSDVNDNIPAFGRFSYRSSVFENEVGAVAVVVNASDVDEGLAGEISYTIRSGNADGAFKVDDAGRLMTARKLDREVKSTYELIIRATDRAGDPKHSEVEVDIEVTDVNDNAPIIGKIPAVIMISEATLKESQVFTVTATDPDAGESGKISFYGVSQDGKFKIDKKTGAVHTTSTFDHETQSSHTFYVGAHDNGNPMLNSTMITINFTIADTNDNNPVFKPSSLYFVNVKENSPLGTTVVRVNASEKDSFSRIGYHLSNGNEDEKFVIDNTTGVISVIEHLDREKRSTYYLLVTASDNDVPPRLGQAYVTVTVTDVNDLAPRFKFRDYKAEVMENSARGMLVLKMSASDPDSANETELTYSIVEGNIGNSFSIETSGSGMEEGLLKTAGTIDREIIPVYNLKVSVSDGIHTDAINVTVKVLDENDNRPSFNLSLYKASVYENSPVGQYVTHVYAIDNDEGSNAVLKYSFAAKNSFFKMNEVTGVVTTSNATLDRERQASYGILCKAEDRNKQTAFAFMIINILDRNDQAPVFSPSSYSHTMAEGPTTEGSIIATVKATDKDDGDANITYSIIGRNIGNTFIIDPQTGVIRARKAVDREEHGILVDDSGKGIFPLTIQAADNGEPNLLSAIPANVTVFVYDVNDNAPTFIQNGFSVFISEGTLANQNVTIAKAVDKDTGQNAKIKYEIIAGNDAGDFKIDEVSGMIQTTKDLHRQRTFSYNLTITARDHGANPLMSQTFVHITVGDTNDNIPVFSKRIYAAHIYENIPDRTALLNVSASDADQGQNAAITYSIIAGNEEAKFSILPKKDHGTIYVEKALDREVKSVYKLTIMAKDGGIPFSRTAIASVLVLVIDTNDNPPVLTQHSYSAKIAENTPGGTTIPLNTPIYATDADTGANAKIVYTISGENSSLFAIDANTGTMKVVLLDANLSIDYELKKRYDFTVTAANVNNPKLKSIASVGVEILDVNDNIPAFSQVYYSAEIRESMQVGRVVLKLKAIDNDSGVYGRVSYYITSGSDGKFVIDRNIGDVKVLGELDRESKAFYLLNVSAVDGALHPHTGQCTVGISIVDVNDNAPEFEKNRYDVTIPESTPVNRSIARVQARDKDNGSYGIVRYSLRYALHADAFEIDARTGLLYTTQLLDRETVAIYELIVTATDSEGLGSNASVIVAVSDVNDNAPVFLNPDPLLVDVFEKTPSGSIIAIVSAKDADVAENARLRYSLHANTKGLFRIDEDAGVIRLNTSLDYSALHREGVITAERGITVHVNATDNGTPRLFSSISMVVRIIDINEENPYFNSSIYHVTMMENRAIGSMVIQVQARKKSSLSKLTYSFVTNEESFVIDKISCNVTTSSVLDREKQDKHILNVKVNDNEFPPRFGYTTIVVSVLDDNDNRPKFDSSINSMHIREDASVGQQVGIVKAIDADIGSNGLIFYKVTHADIGDAGEMVSVDNICKMELGMASQAIQASQISSSSTLVELNKDFSPTQARLNNVRYVQNGIEYQGTWCSGITNPHQYLQVDFGVKKIVTRIATQGMPQGSSFVTSYRIAFSQDGKSWIYTSQIFSGNVDAESVSTQDIIPEIRARFIRIFPLGWKHRICLRTEFYGCDNDDFKILRIPFQLQKEQGFLNVSEPLDRERRNKYKIRIQAYDNGVPSMSTSKIFEVNLVDVNDNYPRFSSAIYETVLPENSIPGRQVFKVFANDSDVGKNSLIRYSLADPSSKFIIEGTSGVVRVSGQIDYEKRAERSFLLLIKATDSGLPALTSFAKLLINITDVNDNAPAFNQSEYSLDISENTENGSVFTILHVRDIDTRDNAKISYSLSRESSFFAIDNRTGHLQVMRNIDREKIQRFNFVIIAKDSGVPRLQSTVKLTVNVQDKNDNSPRFTKKEYSTKLSERTNVGSMVMTVQATDLDVGLNSKINYSIASSNDTDMFQINPSTGEITLLKPLDRETKSLIKFIVIAEDSGTPRLSDLATVVFSISDENDNSPRFNPDIISISVKEDASVDMFIVKVNATDRDAGVNGELMYSLVHGADGKFKIDRDTGSIHIASSLDRENKSSYSIVVMASDKSVTPLLGFARVTVAVLDINDNKPSFLELNGPLYIMENMPNGTIVGRISASDKDLSDNSFVEFEMADNDSSALFRIDSKSGLITTKQDLDRESREFHSITVIANNTRAKPFLASAKSFTIHVLDTNDNAPYVIQSTVIGTVSEAANIGTNIVQIVGADKDVGTNAKLSYNIRYDLSDRQADFVAINSKTGFLVTRLSILDREIRNVTLTVEVSDYGIPYPLNSTKEIFIIINDVNDNGPIFSTNLVRTSVSESAPVGTHVIFVIANDKDLKSNSETIYEILSGNELGHFQINNKTGSISVSANLNRELLPVYHLNISAVNVLELFNSKDRFIADTAVFQIRIDDVNDNSPVFTRKVFTGGVPAGAQIGTYIMDIKAIDKDVGANAAVFYEFVSGNQQNLFRIDHTTGKVYSASNFVGKSGMRFELTISAKDNNGKLPFNVAANLTTARIYVLKDSQRVWLVIGVDATQIENNKVEFVEVLSNITENKVYLESIIKIWKSDGSSRSEIIFHAVNEDLGIIVEGAEIKKTIEKNKAVYKSVYSKWKIEQDSTISSSGQSSKNDEMKTYVIPLIVIGIMFALLLVFAICMLIRSRKREASKEVSPTDFISPTSKLMTRKSRRAHRFSENEGNWVNQYEDWWRRTSQKSATTRSRQDSLSQKDIDPADTYLYESKINLLKQGMLGIRNRSVAGETISKAQSTAVLGRIIDNPVALENLSQETSEQLEREDTSMDSECQLEAGTREEYKEVTSL
eukprot:gene20074-22044_t